MYEYVSKKCYWLGLFCTFVIVKIIVKTTIKI